MRFLVALAFVCIATTSALLANHGHLQYPGFPPIKLPPTVVAPAATTVGGAAAPPTPPPPPPPPTLSQDIFELYAVMNVPAIEEISHRYMRNDREFQTLVRLWNSYNFTMLLHQLYVQPEYVAFKTVWDTELLMSGPLEELEMEGLFTLTNPNPFWGNQCNGVAGFVQEIRAAANEFFLRQHINRKLMTRGSLYNVYTSMAQLPFAIDRVLLSPQAQTVLDELSADGIDLKWIVEPLYSICGFPQLPQIMLPATTSTSTSTTTSTTTTPTAVVDSSSTAAALPAESTTSSVAAVAAAVPEAPAVAAA